SGDALRTNLLEFWNPAITRVWTTDDSLVFPGPTFTPHLVSPDGALSNPPGTSFLLADSGITPVGTPIARRKVLRLYRMHGPVRLRESLAGVDDEGWMGTKAAYNRFSSSGPGTLVVSLSRLSYCPDAKGAPPAPTVALDVGSIFLGVQN